MVLRCFPNAQNGPDLANDAFKKSTSTVSAKGKKIGSSRGASLACLRLLKQFGKGGKIRCRLCSKDVVVRDKRFPYNSRHAVDHATAIHLKKPLYSCKRCSKTFASQTAMYHHVKIHHDVCAKGNYADHSGPFEAEIIRTIMECYDQNFKKRSKVK